jgi:hypothetical protein
MELDARISLIYSCAAEFKVSSSKSVRLRLCFRDIGIHILKATKIQYKKLSNTRFFHDGKLKYRLRFYREWS